MASMVVDVDLMKGGMGKQAFINSYSGAYTEWLGISPVFFMLKRLTAVMYW